MNVGRKRPNREPPGGHELGSIWTSDGQTGHSCGCGWQAPGGDRDEALRLHVAENQIDLEAQRQERQQRMSQVYDMIWSRVLGPNYGLIVGHMTIDEARALTALGLSDKNDPDRERKIEAVQRAVERIVAERGPRGGAATEDPPEPMTSHPLEAISPQFAAAVRRRDSFGLTPCLRSLPSVERLALMNGLLSHSAKHRAFDAAWFAAELLDAVLKPTKEFPYFSLSHSLSTRYRSIVGRAEPVSREQKRENRRMIRAAQKEGKRRRANGDADREREHEVAFESKIRACVPRLDVRTAIRELRGADELDRSILLIPTRRRLSGESADRFDAAVCEAASWLYEGDTVTPGVVDMLVTTILIALRDAPPIQAGPAREQQNGDTMD